MKKKLVIRESKTKNVPGFPTSELIKGAPAILISQAIHQGSDLDKLERLLALQKDWEANESKKAFHKAMAEFKANLPQIMKEKKVSYEAGSSKVKYSYASLFNIVDKVTPIMSKYGLSVAWTHRQDEKNIFVTCRITHEFGYSEETTIGAPADTTGAKNAIQAIGSTISYLERYSFLGLIGAAAKDMDDDTRSIAPAVTEYIDDKQKTIILDWLINLDKSEKSFNKTLGIESIDKLPKAMFDKAIALINAERKRQGK